MGYNLLFDTQFNNEHHNWKYVNCSYKDGYLISRKKVFGVEQEIILPDITKLYFRFNYNILTSNVVKVYAGIQSEDKLFINKKWTKIDTNQSISVVEDIQTEKVKVHIIFESTDDVNKVQIGEPILSDLRRLKKTTWLKFVLDKVIKYRSGFNYKNLLPYNEIRPKIFNLEPAKIGSIISTKEPVKLKIDAKLNKGKRYLIKLDYLPINNLGKIYLSYGVMNSTNFNGEQEYLLIRATNNQDIYLNIEPNDVLPYQLNLKHLLLIETEGVGIELKDIPYLPFIGD